MKTKLRALPITLLIILLFSCGGDDYQPPPDITGLWSGTFMPDTGFGALDVAFDVSAQNGENFTGSWGDSGEVSGYIFTNSDGSTYVGFTLSSYQNASCCVPLFGCWLIPYEDVEVNGLLENDSVTDFNASHRSRLF